MDYANTTNVEFIVDPKVLFHGWLIYSYLQIFKLIKCKWLPGECADWFFDNIMTWSYCFHRRYNMSAQKNSILINKHALNREPCVAGYEYHRPIITNACPPKPSQKSLHPKIVPITLTVFCHLPRRNFATMATWFPWTKTCIPGEMFLPGSCETNDAIKKKRVKDEHI